MSMIGLHHGRFYAVVSLALVITLTAGLVPLAAQTASAGTVSTTVPKIEYPQWSRDLRRAEIIAFGTIPFSWLVATVFMDLSRTAAHGGSDQYWPWPLKPSGAPPMTDGEFISTIGIAAGISVVAAIADLIIVKYKRKKAEREELLRQQREPDIIRIPAMNFNGETGETPPSLNGAEPAR
jgi:hypothetical protein